MKPRDQFLAWVLIIYIFCLILLIVDAKAGPYMDGTRAAVNKTWNSPCAGNWRLNVTDDMPTDSLGIWYATDPCTINLRPPRAVGENYQTWCMLGLHESGHMAGQDHSSDPNNVMYPEILSPTDFIHPACREEPRVKEKRHVSRSQRRPDPWRGSHQQDRVR